MHTVPEITDALRKFLAERVNPINHSELVVTTAPDEWIIEELEVPLITIAYETGLFDALDSLRAALPLWGLTLS